MGCTLYEPGFAVLVRSLGDHAPRAILQMTFVGGLASTAFIPLSHILVERLGWRPALVVLAGINLLAATLVHAIVLRPAAGAGPAMAGGGARAGLTARAAMADSRFWGFLVAFATYNLAFTAMVFHLLPLLDERGIDRAAAVALFTFIGPMQVTGRLVLLAVEGRVSARAVGRGLFLAAVPMILLLLAAGADLRILALFIIVYGVINGLLTVVRGTVIREAFGAASYGAIQGRVSPCRPTSRARWDRRSARCCGASPAATTPCCWRCPRCAPSPRSRSGSRRAPPRRPDSGPGLAYTPPPMNSPRIAFCAADTAGPDGLASLVSRYPAAPPEHADVVSRWAATASCWRRSTAARRAAAGLRHEPRHRSAS